MLGFGIVQFGSYASGKATEKSDLDFLVEFKTRHIDLFTLSGLRIDLEESFSIPVDVVHAPISEDSLLEIEEVIPIYEQA